MQSIASFNAVKQKKSYIVKVSNLRRDEESVAFQFDTGAGMTIIGYNTICDEEGQYEVLDSIVRAEINENGIDESAGTAQTVTRETLHTYPCVCRGVSISGTKEIDLYFHIYLGPIAIPLLGYDYIDDCTCYHTIGGDFLVTAVAENVGKRFYPEKVLDFNRILDEFYATIK